MVWYCCLLISQVTNAQTAKTFVPADVIKANEAVRVSYSINKHFDSLYLANSSSFKVLEKRVSHNKVVTAGISEDETVFNCIVTPFKTGVVFVPMGYFIGNEDMPYKTERHQLIVLTNHLSEDDSLAALNKAFKQLSPTKK